MSLLLRGGEVRGAPMDLRIAGGRIAQMAPHLSRRVGEEVVDAEGGAVLPGLVDHHLHLHALAASMTSVRCGPPEVRDRVALTEALTSAPSDGHGWVRGTGYSETVAGPLDAAALDALHPHRPVRVQHRSGALWMVNSAASVALGLASAAHPGVERDHDGHPTGRLWRADDWMRTRLPAADPPPLGPVATRLAGYGITHVTDATPDLDRTALQAMAGAVPQHVQVLGAPLGWLPPVPLTVGPYKIVLADSGLPGLAELIDRVRAAHDDGRGIAAHCVTREALLLLLVALEHAGAHPDDRIEHASLVPAETVSDLARRRLRVVTQPGFLAARGQDYLRDVPAGDHGDLYRCATLLAEGVRLALSSDAPYGPLDPWTVIAAAVERRAGDGAVIGPGEQLTPRAALAAYLSAPDDPGGPPRPLAAGAPADLMILDRPLEEQLRNPQADAVRTLLIEGQIIHDGLIGGNDP